MQTEGNLDVPRRVKLAIKDFLSLNEAGTFHEFAKAELIDGDVVATKVQFVRHALFQSRFFLRLAKAIECTKLDCEALVEASVAIPPRSMPRPDMLVTSFIGLGNVAVPISTVLLIVEVADASLAYDVNKRARIYSMAGLPEYWVADLAGGKIHRFWSPLAKGYGNRDFVGIGKRIEAKTIAELVVDTNGL